MLRGDVISGFLLALPLWHVVGTAGGSLSWADIFSGPVMKTFVC